MSVYLVGIPAIFIGIFLGCWLIPKIAAVIIKHLVAKEMKDIDLPFHTFNNFSLRTFLGDAEPRTYPYLSEKLLLDINDSLRKDHALLVETATQGISSDNKMIEYLKKTGLLNEIGVSQDEVQKKLSLIDCTKNKFASKAAYARYNPVSPPQGPVRLPAEFEPIGAVLLSFPIYYPLSWKTHAEFIRQIISEADAFVIVPNEHWQKAVMLYLTQREIPLDSVRFLHFITDDVWMRDYGPTSILIGTDQRPAFIWNPYYIRAQNYYKFDADAAAALSMNLDIPVYRLPMVIEGGNIITDGKGTVMIMESVLDVNPDIDKQKLKTIAKDYFGCTRLITFPQCKGEITGHIDMIIKFVDEDIVMVCSSEKGFKWYNDFENMASELSKMKSVNGKPYTVIRVPMPKTSNNSKNVWSYINSLTLNKKVIVPIFNVPEDKEALEIYRSAMPNHEIAGIDFHRYPVGSVHCQSKEIYQKILNHNG